MTLRQTHTVPVAPAKTGISQATGAEQPNAQTRPAQRATPANIKSD